MDQAARIAYVQAQTICALAEIEGMRAANAIAMWNLQPPPHDKAAFDEVPGKYQLHHNQVVSFLAYGT